MNARTSVVAVAEQPAADPPRRSSPPIVMVVWHDAWADSEQHDRAEWRSDYLVRTTGFLVREEADVVSIAQEILPEEDGFRAVTHIPSGMIESLTELSTGIDLCVQQPPSSYDGASPGEGRTKPEIEQGDVRGGRVRL